MKILVILFLIKEKKGITRAHKQDRSVFEGL